MRLLLDTHIVLWVLMKDKRNLKRNVLEAVENFDNPCFVSIASLWEISIKASLGKLQLRISLKELFELLKKTGFEQLPISERDLLTLQNLPFHHQDPFDRIIIAQAMESDLLLVSKDRHFDKYEVKLLKN